MDGITLALRGLRDAAEAIDLADPEASVLRASEALFWATALDEQSDPSARHSLAPATAMARNAVAHGVVVCAGVTEGLSWPLTWPLRWADLSWVSTSAIREGLSRPVASSTLYIYDTRMAGASVTDTLRELVAWYERTT